MDIPTARSLRGLIEDMVYLFLQVVHRDRKYYYSIYYGSNNTLMLLLKNFLRPKRFLTKFIYGQIVPLPVAISRGQALPKFTPSSDAIDICSQLKRTGVVVLPGAYQDVASYLIEKFNLRSECYQPSNNYQSKTGQSGGEQWLKPLGREVLGLMVDDLVLQVMGLYWGRQPYVRNQAALAICMPGFDQKTTRETLMSKENLNMGWHYDTVNMLQFAILLNDVSPSGTHMQVGRGTHRAHRVNMGKYDYFYSDEFARDSCESISFVGPVGTACLFDSNAIHRLFAVKSSPRIWVKVEYTPGNAIESEKVTFEHGVTVDHLTPLQRNSLRYLL